MSFTMIQVIFEQNSEVVTLLNYILKGSDDGV
jgi:hypothetical protein